MNATLSRRTLILAAACAVSTALTSAYAQKRYDSGVSDTEIKVGNILPYSGPVSAFATIGKTAGAYFAKVNAEGGVNGRKINYISLDDAYSPPKTVEQARKLVEQDEVLLIFLPVGTAHNAAIQKYMNAKKVPQLFVGAGGLRWGNIKEFPWTMGWQPTNHTEAKSYGLHIAQSNPKAKVAVLMQNDDFGKDYLKGLLEGLGDSGKSAVVQSYETSDPTVDSQIFSLKTTGADTLVILATPKFGAMAIKKADEIGWKPTRYIASPSQSVSSVLKPAGLEASKGVISATYLRDPNDPATQATKEYADYAAFMKQYYPAGDLGDSLNLIGYSAAQTLVQTLKQAGDELTRENVMKQALNLNMTLPMLYPGIVIKTDPNDAYPIEQWQLVQFDGNRYVPIGGVISGR